MPDPQYKDVKDLVKDLHNAAGNPAKQDWGGAVFWIGAGCSRSADILLASEIAQECAIKLAHKYRGPKFRNADKALSWLCSKGYIPTDLTWGELYGVIFQEHYKSPRDQQDIILEAINRGKDKINWTHVCLGELVRRGYIHTVLTTNFDQLVLQGIINTGLLPVVADGIESLTRVASKPKKPQVVHLHGSMHTYNLVNSKKALIEAGQSGLLGATIHKLLQDSRMLVVVGYAGGEEGVMDQLIEAVKSFKNTMVYWVMYEDNHLLLSQGAQKLLALGDHKYVIPNLYADKLFADNLFIDIMEGLEIGAPEWMQKPTSHLLKQSKNFASSQDERIQEHIQRYQEKVRHLNELWKTEEETQEKTQKLLDEIRNLQLEGRYDKALNILRRQKRSNNHEIWRMHAETAYELGQHSSNRRLSGNNLKESIEAWKQVLHLVPKQKDIDVWCEAQIGLGNALQLLYELEEEKKHIEEAVSAYHAALEGNTLKSTPLNWAKTQANLGEALLTLGQTEDNEDDIDYLEEAVMAYKLALKVYTRKSAPLEWARAKDHLGSALLALGSIKADIELLEKAELACQEVLKFYSKADKIDLTEWVKLIESVKKNLKQILVMIKRIKGTQKR